MHPKEDDKTRWDKKYNAGSHAGSEPDEFLVRAFQEFLFSAETAGQALDLAGGAGRHALWLAQHGWRVKLIDVAEAAVSLAEQRAQQMHVRGLTTEVRDLSAQPDLGDGQFDLIVVFYFLDRQLFPSLIRALRPAGFLVYKTCTVEQQKFGRGPSDPRFLLKPNELREAFKRFEILHYGETVTDKATAELVARKV